MVALQKTNQDYSKLCMYRLIQLLEVLGKTLERIQARRLAFFTAKYCLFPSTQYGGITGRSAQDTILSTYSTWHRGSLEPWPSNHDANVWHHQLLWHYTTYCSFLIDTLHKANVLLPIVKWVHSFIQERQAMICLDGKWDSLKPVNTGVPQGSCTSPILVAYFTAPMCKVISRGTTERIEKDPELSTLICTGKASYTPLTLQYM